MHERQRPPHICTDFVAGIILCRTVLEFFSSILTKVMENGYGRDFNTNLSDPWLESHIFLDHIKYNFIDLSKFDWTKQNRLELIRVTGIITWKDDQIMFCESC